MYCKKISPMHMTTLLWESQSANRRILWFTILMSMDKDGFVELCDKELKLRSRLPEIEFYDAINFLLGKIPDCQKKYIEECKGGYQILNLPENKTKKTKASWKVDYHQYLAMAEHAYNKLITDWEFLWNMKDYYPNVNIRKSIRKSFDCYWGTKEGWNNKKRKQNNDINWKGTIQNTIRHSLVWIPKASYDNEYDYLKSKYEELINGKL